MSIILSNPKDSILQSCHKTMEKRVSLQISYECPDELLTNLQFPEIKLKLHISHCRRCLQLIQEKKFLIFLIEMQNKKTRK